MNQKTIGFLEVGLIAPAVPGLVVGVGTATNNLYIGMVAFGVVGGILYVDGMERMRYGTGPLDNVTTRIRSAGNRLRGGISRIREKFSYSRE